MPVTANDARDMLTQAVTALFVPADRPERIDKARASAADAVIVDLEDAVGPNDKAHARRTLADWLTDHDSARLIVRINAAGTPDHEADIALCRAHEAIAVIMLPKAESTHDIARAAATGRAVWPLVETPAGIQAAQAIAQAPGVARLAFGALDFAAAIGLDADHPAGRDLLDHARHVLVLAGAAAGLTPPIDSPVPAFRDTEPVRQAADRAVAMGFGGLLAIHPAQLEPIRRAFTPSADSRARAERIVAAAKASPGAVQLDGQMIDAPVVERARRLLALAERLN